MPSYRLKDRHRFINEAFRWYPYSSDPMPEWFTELVAHRTIVPSGKALLLKTAHGDKIAHDGDWILRGNVFPNVVSPAEFELRFEPVPEEAA